MKTLNLHYKNDRQLQDFILRHNLHQPHSLLIQVFTGIVDRSFITTLIATLRDLLPKSRIIGATSDGIINNHTILQYDTLISFTRFNTTQVETYLSQDAKNSYQLGREIEAQFPTPQKIKAAICLSDGLHTNGEEFLDGLMSSGREILVAGGMAGDNGEFKKTFVFSDRGITSNGAVAAILYGDDLIIHNDYNFGWAKIGKALTITKSEKNRVYTINGMSAVDIYAKYIGDEVSNKLPTTGIEFPLIINRNGIDTARAVLKKHSDNSLSFAGNIQEGEKVRFGYGNAEHILRQQKRFLKTLQNLPVESIFIYSCMARKKLLGANIVDEITPYSNLTNVNGFFTYGEFYHSTQKAQLLNETKTLLILSEDPNSFKKTVPPQNKSNSNDAMQTVNALSHLIDQTTKELVETNKKQVSLIRNEVEMNRQKDQLLLQQSKLAQMGEMLGMIAHQWRQPLNAIAAASSSLMLKSQLKSLNKDTLESKLKDIDGYVQHLSTTIDDFRTFFKPDRTKERTDITEIMQSLDWIVGNIYKSAGITLHITIESQIKPFLSYPNELKQVILNLVKNAKDAIVESGVTQGKINIAVYTKEGQLHITIKDNGGGVPEAIKDKIFEFYFTTKKKDGTGIGLYMSKVIVEQHLNGSITFSNRDIGAEFVIKLGAEDPH